MFGDIVIRDAIGLSTKLSFDGNQYITIQMSKSADLDLGGFVERKFVIYDQKDRKDLNQTSEIYTLKFVSEEFLLSAQKVVEQKYTGTYSEIVQKILKDYLKVDFVSPQIGHIEPTKGLHNYIPTKYAQGRPFAVINELAKKAINEKGLADYVFYQTHYGYNFISLSTLLSESDPIIDVTFGAKNLNQMDFADEFYGARDVKVISQFNLFESIDSGAHAGKFVGYDTLTGDVETQKLSFNKDIFDLRKTQANKTNISKEVFNKNKKSSFEEFDSKLVVYPFSKNRNKVEHLKQKDSKSANNIDDTHNYKFQRSALLGNLMQRRLRIVMPGNFMLNAGYSINLKYPNRFNEYLPNDDGDETLSGRYVILTARHIIRYDKHETIIEVATDSTLRDGAYQS
jgi:hypothetical protein